MSDLKFVRSFETCQEKFIEFYNSQEGEFKGKKMASLPDILKTYSKPKIQTLNDIRNNMGEKGTREEYCLVIITNTHIKWGQSKYNKNNFNGLFTNHFKSEITKPKKKYLKDIPANHTAKAKSINELIKTKEGCLYLSALTDVAEPDKLPGIIQNLCGIELKDIGFFIPYYYKKIELPFESAVALVYFHKNPSLTIMCDFETNNTTGDIGFSFGIPIYNIK